VCDIGQTAPLTAFMLMTFEAGKSGGCMQDRDGFHHLATRPKLGEATKTQQENVAAQGRRPKALDLDDPEQRRRFMEGEV
jgi:hypothetical protein